MIVSALSALGLGFVWTDGALAGEAVRRAGYPMLFATALGFVWAIARCLRGDGGAWRSVAPGEWIGRGRRGLANWRARPWREFCRSIACMVAGGTLVCALAEPIGFKILFDEYVLQATAQNLHLTREVGTIVRAYEVEGVWLPLGAYVDKRPYFFAFVLSLLHDLSGFRVLNAFILNHALTALLLALVGVTVRRLTGRVGAGVLAGWSLAALPLLGQNTNGSGMEVLNAVMIVGVFLLGLRFLERPDDARQDALLLGAVLLAQCRYESALFVPAAGLLVLVAWFRRGAARLTIVTMLVPVALLPVAWVRQVFAANDVLWQLPEHLSKPFGTEHVADNLVQAGRYVFSTNVAYSNLAPLAVAGLLALSVIGFLFFRRRFAAGPGAASLASLVWFAAVLFNFVLLMHYYWGQLTDPLVSRLSLPLWIVFAVALAALLARLEAGGRKALGPALVLSLVIGLALHGRAAARHVYTQENILEQEIRWELDWVAGRPAGPRMVITNKSSLPWLLERVPAVLTNSARGRAAAINFHLRQNGYQEILVTQRLRPGSAAGDFALDPDDALPPEIRLERVAERRFGYSIATISRVVAVEPTAPALSSP
jgi:hypothetical protein